MPTIIKIFKPNSRFGNSTFLVIFMLAFLFSGNANSKEFLQKEGDLDTISCITDDISMKKYRDRCMKNFPELKGEIENAYRLWAKTNAPRLEEVSAACKERLAILETDDPRRLNEIRQYAENNYAQFITRTGSGSTNNALTDCKMLIKELASPESSVPAYLADKIRNVTLKTDYDTTALEFGTSPVDLDLRSVAEKIEIGTESLKQNFKFSPGENRDNIFVQKSSLSGRNAFKAFKINNTKYDQTVVVYLSITPEGAKRFKAATRNNPGMRVALVLKNEVLFVASLREITLLEDKLFFISTPERAGYMKRQIQNTLNR